MIAQQEVLIPTKGAEKVQGILLSCIAIGYILLQLFPFPEIELFQSTLILIIFFWILPGVRGTSLYICLSLLLSAVFLMLYHRISIQDWSYSLRVNTTLVAIFLFVPLLGIPVKTGGYVKAIKIVLSNKMNEPYFFYLGTNFLTHILGVVLNIGSILIVNQLTLASNIRAPRLIGSSLNRGFTTTIFWSPYFSAMALILSQLSIKWSSIVFYSIGLVFISFFVSILIDKKDILEANPLSNSEKPVLTTTYDEGEVKQAKKKVTELFSYLFIITACVLLLEFVTSSSIVIMTCFVSLIFPIVWCLFSRNFTLYMEEFKHHVFVWIPRMKKEILLFLIAGFFSGAFKHGNLGSILVTFIQNTFGSFHLGAAFFLSLTVFLGALISIHPIVSATVYATNIPPELIGLSSEYFAVLLLATWGVSNTISPTTAVNSMLANILKVNLFDISIRWNLKYVIIMLFIIPIYLKVVGL